VAIGAATTTGRSPFAAGLSRRQRYEQIRAALLLERSSFEAHWRELAEFLMPRRTRFTTSDVNRGDRRSQSIIDSAPRFAARTLQSGLHAGLTSPARPWMRLTTPDPDLAEFGPVKQWLHTVTQRMLTIFLRSNLYNALPTLYGDMGVFGTGAIGVLEDSEDLMRAYSYPLGCYAIGLDERGIGTTFVRDYQMTVRQLVGEFGRDPYSRGRDIDWSRFSTQIKTCWDNGDYEQRIDVCWFITPNDDYEPRRLESQYAMKWRSCHFERGREDSDYKGSGFLR
jgi:Bacteriophage head to tail connecting protein